MGNTDLGIAKKRKMDEFYTRLEDIEKEMVYYREFFEGKTIFMNCDDPSWSNFWLYFSLNFDFLGIKKIISTHYDYDEKSSSYKLVYEQQNNTNKPKVVKTALKGNGDFRSEECIQLLKESDIVITNPPFSVWREYVSQLIEYEKKFIIIGNTNAITYREVFPLLKNNKMWLGNTNFNVGMYFGVPDSYDEYHKIENGKKLVRVSTSCWYTNIETPKRQEKLVLTKFYEGNEDYYPRYDNYNAIEVSTYKDIPLDYRGVMGVPITFIDKFNPEQFEIIGESSGRKEFEDPDSWPTKRYVNAIQHNKNGTTANGSKVNTGAMILNNNVSDKVFYTVDNAEGKLERVYKRIFIRNKTPLTKQEILGF